MSIIYTGAGVALTPVPQTLATVASGTKSANVVHVQVTNLDYDFMRTLYFWMRIIGGRNLVIVENADVPYGQALQFSGISLAVGESLQAYSDTSGLVVCNVSLGEQK